MYAYTAHGLGIHSALPLPGLSVGNGAADVLIRFGKLGLPRLDGYSNNICLHTRGGHLLAKEVYLSWAGAGSLRVSDGREILVEPGVNGEEEKLRLFILGAAMSVLLEQRGRLVLHANAVTVHGVAAVLLGDSGAGKSTLSAGLLAQGHGVLADDVAAIDVAGAEAPLVYPGLSSLKLLPDVVASLGESPESLPKLYRDSEKRMRHTASSPTPTPHKLSFVFVLREGDRTGAEPLRPSATLMELARHSSAAQRAGAAGIDGALFQQCAVVAGHVRGYLLTRARALSTLPALVALVQEHLADGSPSRCGGC